MNYAQVAALFHQFVPANLADVLAKWLGYVTGAYFALLGAGPYAVKAADWLADTVLNSPLRPVAIFFAPSIVKGLDAISAALVNLVTTFKSELEKDLAKAAAANPPAEPPAAPPAQEPPQP
jgi:hypothetical protein